jgi:transcriptional regulator with XRE-family HTH domain
MTTKFETWRKDHDLTYEKVASLLKMNRGSARRVVQGLRWPRPETVLLVEEVTGGSVNASDLAHDAAVRGGAA